MDASVVVVMFGLILLIVSLKFLIDPKEVKNIEKDITSSHGLMFIAGLIPLTLGVLVLAVYGPVYGAGHMEMLTVVLGAILFLIGLFRLWCRKRWCDLVKECSKSESPRGTMFVFFIVSILLLLVGGGVIAI